MMKENITSSLAHFNLNSHKEGKMKKDIQRLGLAIVIGSLAMITGCEQKQTNNEMKNSKSQSESNENQMNGNGGSSSMDRDNNCGC